MTIEQLSQILLSPQNRIGVSTSYKNCFRSWCRFNEAFFSYWLANKNKWGSSSVSQYTGAHIFDYLFWDIDKANKNEQGIEIADLATATKLLEQLLEHVNKHYGLEFEHFRVWLSAGKGYHPYLPAGLFTPYPHDLNNSAAVIFTERLFPDGWVRKHQLGGILDPTTLKDINRLDRQGGSQNYKPEREWNGFKVGCNKEMWEALQKECRERSGGTSVLYHEFANEPSLLYLSEDYLDGSAYWQVEPNQKLVELWKESLERAVVEKEGKRLSVPSGGAANGQSTGVSFFIPETLEVPQCIRNMHKQLQSGEIKGGFRHGVFMVLASFYSRLLPQAAVLSLMSGLNQSLSNPKPEEEIEKIINDVFERGYRTGCGNPNSDLGQTCLAFCNARASIDECPKHKSSEDGGLIARHSMGIHTAQQKMIARMKQGLSPIKLGIDEWDEAIGNGHRLGEMLTFVGFPESSKTATVTRIVQPLSDIAKSLNMLVILFTPENDNETVAELLTQQRGKMCGQEIYEHATNGGFDPVLNKWFEDMQETLISVSAVFFTIQDIKRTLDFWEKKLGKKTMCVILDGVIFFSPGEFGKARRPDEEVAKYLQGLCVDHPYFGIYNLHVEKQGGSENDKDKKPSEQKLKGNAGFGTGHYYNASQFYVPLNRRDSDVVWNIKKFRKGFKPVEPPQEIVFRFYRPHYYPYTQSEVDQIIRQHGLGYFNGDPRFMIPSGFKLEQRI